MSDDTKKIAVILRGVPGSGKSSFVDTMLAAYPLSMVHSIDDLHIDDSGNFLWNEKEQEKLYLLNYCNFVKSCSKKIPIVIVDCINIQICDFEKYISAARMFGYQVYVVTPDMPTASDAASRNRHHVSSTQVDDMYERWESWPSESEIALKMKKVGKG